MYFEGGYQETSVYLLEELRAGHQLDGPVVVIDTNSTILIEPHCQATITKNGDIKIKVLSHYFYKKKAERRKQFSLCLQVAVKGVKNGNRIISPWVISPRTISPWSMFPQDNIPLVSTPLVNVSPGQYPPGQYPLSQCFPRTISPWSVPP